MPRKDLEAARAWQRQYGRDHREERNAYQRKYMKDHSEERNQYRKDNPLIYLKIQKKLYKKMGLTKYQIQAWTKVIRKGKNCSYCDSDKDIHSHHIFPKSKYKDLALNENNGVVLCDPCHKEHHHLNGVN